jgi:two-component system C4-dicarboxylate transport response regulator DctD
MIRQVLVVDDDMAVREALAQTLELGELSAHAVGSFIEAKDHIAKDYPGIILSDIRMPGRDGFYLLDYVQKLDSELPVIMLTGEGDIPMAVRAMGQGAFGFLEKPCAPADLLAVIERALKTRELVLENRRLKAQLETGDPAARLIFGSSVQADALRARVRLAGQSRTEVLVSGPPGSGISKVAEVVHLMSPRAKMPFVKRTATGMEGPALTEAFEAAQGGSLFLDDIGALPAETQFALLQRLEKTDNTVRLIAGSTADLHQAVQDNGMNSDLYYRLQVLDVRIPALAERRDDIPVLFQHYVEQASEQAGLTPPDITSDVLAGLMAQDWPGNARALMSAAMRFALGLGAPEAEEQTHELGLAEQLARVEQSLLIAALQRAQGRASEAAIALKLPRKTFYDKLARYHLKPENYR